MSDFAPGHRVIESPELGALLTAGADVVVLDVRAAFPSGHLPGAFSVDVDAWAGLDRDGRLEALRALGVDDASLVVTCGDHKGLAAGRLALILERAGLQSTALLDGGYDAWWRLGMPTTTDVTPPARRGDVTLGAPVALECSSDEVGRWASRRALVDVRTRSRFKVGHVPGAVNVPVTAFGDQAGRVLDAASMAVRLRRSGVDPRVPFAVYCDDGSASAWVAYVARRAGFDVRLLPEGFTWGDFLS